MNRDTVHYVLSLGKRVTTYQRLFLMVLAAHHQTARETWWPSRKKLAAEMATDEQQIRRAVADLQTIGILKYEAGLGAGNHSSYIFCELEVRDSKGDMESPLMATKGDEKGDTKGDFFDPPIRKDKIFTKAQDQNQTLPNPPLQGGNRVTKRDLQKVKAQIEYLRNLNCKLHPGCGRTQGGRCWGCYAEQLPEQPFFPVENDELRDACEDLLLGYEAVREALDEIQFPSLKKEPQRVAG